jgi:hypothetical protein
MKNASSRSAGMGRSDDVHCYIESTKPRPPDVCQIPVISPSVAVERRPVLRFARA